jgi:hypothetical protein
MDIKTVEYRRLVSFGQYENETLGATACVGETEHPIDALTALAAWVEARIADRAGQRTTDHERAMARNHAEWDLAEIEQRIATAKVKWSRWKQFMERLGITVEDYVRAEELPFD